MLKKDEKKEWDRLDKWLKQFTDIKEIIGLGGNIRAFLNAHKLKKMKSDDFLKKYKNLRNLEMFTLRTSLFACKYKLPHKSNQK